MKAWGKGESNSGLMNTIPEYKGLGGKVKDKPKVEDKVVDYLQQYRDSRKQGKVPTDLIEKVKEQIAKTITNNKAQLEKDYRYITEEDVRNHHKLRGKLSVQELLTYRSYVQTSNSFKINKRLYSGKYATAKKLTEIDRKIDKLTDLIDTDKLDNNSRFVRFIGDDYLKAIYKQLNLGKAPTSKAIHSGNGVIDLNADLMGKIITNEAFTSVSYNQNANVFTDSPIKMEIYADKGSKCLYTYNYEESEVVLQRGTQFKIKGIEIVKEKDSWGDDMSYIKLIVQTVSKKY